MGIVKENILTQREMITLASIVQVGDATYFDLMEAESPMFGHPYFTDLNGRIRTKLVQRQCEIEHYDVKFPFEFSEIEFCCGHKVPELRNEHMIIHIAQSNSPISLPSKADYKHDLTYNNDLLYSQLKLNFLGEEKFVQELYYGILVFGGRRGKTFCRLQFPEPGYKGIADYIDIPILGVMKEQEETKKFERKKAVLREEVLSHNFKEGTL